MKFVYYLFFIFLTSNIYAIQLSFEDAKKMLLEKNSIIKSYEEETNVSKYRLNQANGNFLPKINFSETFISTDEPASAAFSKISQGKFNNSYMAKMADPDTVKNFETKLEIIQPIMMNGKVYFGSMQAKEMYNASLSVFDAVKQELLYNLVKAYYGKVLAEKSVEVTENSLIRTRRYKDMTEDFYKNGLLVKSDLLVSESRVSLGEAYLAEAKKQVEISNSFLERLLDLNESVSIIWSDININVDKTVDEYIAIAMDNRKDLKVMENYAKVYDYENRKSKMNFLPEIVAFANYKMNDSTIFGNSGNGFTIGAMLNLNLFSGFGDKNRISETKSSYIAFNHKIMDKKNEIKTEVKDAYYSIIASEKKVESNKKALDAARIALKITESRFKEGLAKITDLLDREFDVKNAELGLYNAEYELIESKARLYKTVGILN
ncbi:MAG: TolC family protein [Calditerrivibrio sp.]|nr:TolC family protein [Calditerrivibrio sp.]MCA1932540.1 TolC family protein [Calditerrivibrio sp.]